MTNKLVFSKKLTPQLKKVERLKFNFKIPSNVLIGKKDLTLKNGGKISVEARRDLDDKVKILSNSDQVQNDTNWSCRTVHYSGEVYNKDTVILNGNFTRIYPGAVFPFESIAKGDYNQPNIERKPLTITTASPGFKKTFVKVEKPDMSGITQGIANMKQGATLSGKAMLGSVYQVLSEEDLFVRTGGSGYYLGFGGQHSVDFSKKSKSHKYLVEMYQTYYDIVVDTSTNEPSDFFVLKSEEPNNPKAIAENLIDPNWVYVDSVSYGRVLYILYESDESFSEFGIDVDMYAKFGFAGGEASLTERQKSFLRKTQVTIATIGGPLLESALLLNSVSFTDLQQRIDNYLRKPGGEAIISYSLRTLDQHTVGAKMVTQFTSRQCAPRASKYKVIWKRVICRKNDDSGNAEEIKAFVRVRAFDGNGKDVPDVDNKNKALIQWAQLPAAARSIVPTPWTFTEGSANNPLELAEGASWNTDKAIVFNVPLGDANAKIGVRADVVEFDDTSANDQFQDALWERKINELGDMQEFQLTCRHEASRIEFHFQVLPVYE